MAAEILLFAVIGFAAQLVDGAVGMAFGLVASAALQALAVAPAAASATIHAAEIVVTGASGLAHWRLGNVDRRLVLRIAIPGAIGGVIGAFLLTDLPLDLIRPVVAIYLIAMSVLILRRALNPHPDGGVPSGPRLFALGLSGGFLDAVGGGGWGPLVTSSLIGQGNTPRQTIGSTNAAEFFVTCAITASFVAGLGLEFWPAILGLVLGGVLAAPLAALVTRHLEARILLLAVGCVVFALGLISLVRAMGIA